MTVPPIEAPIPPLTCLELCAEKQRIENSGLRDYFTTTLMPLLVILSVFYPCTLSGIMCIKNKKNRTTKVVTIIASLSLATLSYFLLYGMGIHSNKYEAEKMQGCFTDCGFG